MRISCFSCILIFSLALTPGCTTTVESASPTISLSSGEATEIGRKIWKNECGGTIDGLTSWNSGEDFASLGIGHFIWYPAGKEGPFDESFPKLLAFYQSRGVSLPTWLVAQRDCPWRTQAEFKRAFRGSQMTSLRKLLADTIGLQTEFVIARLKAALPKMLATAPTNRRAHIERQFNRMAGSTRGLYAMIDYVNFKGEGISPSERYNGQGWGLLQVLDGMDPNTSNPVASFTASAKPTLTRRVKNAPASRNESRWLTGWHNRMNGY